MQPLRVYPDENDKTGVVRIVEAEGKIKFTNTVLGKILIQLLSRNIKSKTGFKTIANVDFKALNKMLFVKDRKRNRYNCLILLRNYTQL